MNNDEALRRLDEAAGRELVSAAAAANIRVWLAEPRYADYAASVRQHLADRRWQELDEVFWTTIPFGTGGRRGKLYPIGTNAINDRTIGESVQGLADYVRDVVGGEALACAIAYDTRHRSRDFAVLAASIMAAAGFKVWFLDGYRSTPELSFAVRYKRCRCGIMITASHNPPSDNAIKVYWSSGGQLLPPHDAGVIRRVMSVGQIERRDFDKALAAGAVEYCQAEVDRAYIAAVTRQSRPGPREIKILYSPLHGVGGSAVLPALAAAGFEDVESYGPQAEPDPDFSNVPDQVANPERAVVFEALIARAAEIDADIALATDPDCDRLGCAAPRTLAAGAEWATLTGNQLGALLAEHLLARDTAEQPSGSAAPAGRYVVKTLVTSELIRRVAEAHGAETVGDLLVGFKYIGGVIDDRGPAGFVLGAEESYGFLIGDHARDKDAAVAAVVLCELAAAARAAGQSLHQRLEALWVRHGYHEERAFSVRLPGAEGMDRARRILQMFRREPPLRLGEQRVTAIRDYLQGTRTAWATPTAREEQPLAGPRGELLMLDLADGYTVAVRPSGTEPLVKFYLFAGQPPAPAKALPAIGQEVGRRLKQIEADVRALVERV